MKAASLSLVLATLSLALTGCDPCREGGSLQIDTEDERAAIESCEVLHAEILVQGSEFETFELPNLRELDGAIIFNGNEKLTSASFPKLELVNHVGIPNAQTSGIAVQLNPELTTLDFPSLTGIGSPTLAASIGISSSPKLTTVNFPVLAQFYGGLGFSNTELESLSFPAIAELAELTVGNNTRLKSISFPALKKASNGVGLDSNDVLTTLEFPLLRSTGEAGSNGGFAFRGHRTLKTLSLPALEKTGLSFTVTDNLGLETLDVPSAIESIPVMAIKDNFALRSIAMPHVSQIGTLNILTNAALETLTFTDLKKVDHLEINSNAKLPTCSVKALVDQIEERDGFKGNALYSHNLADSCGS